MTAAALAASMLALSLASAQSSAANPAGTAATSPIEQHYRELGGASGFLGNPVTPELGTPDRVGRYRVYQGGSIYWTPRTGAHEVHGAIRDTWAALGYERSLLGYPLTDERATRDGTGRFNLFERGSIYWSPQTGAHEVHGVIEGKWGSLGYERGFLGYPVSDERGTPDGVGRFSVFTGGSIYWTPGTDAHEVHGAIRDKWASLGYERGFLGYPTLNEAPTSDGVGRVSTFAGGSIYWTPSLGAHEVHGAIRAKWLSLDAERGRLGYPVSDEFAVPEGRQSDFEHGSITFNAATGEVTVSSGPGPEAATVRASVAYGTTNGDPDGESSRALISGDGRFAVFHSEAQNLTAPGFDTQKVQTDVFVRDLVNNTTQMVSVNYNGQAPNNTSTFPAINYDGCFIAFQSEASDTVPQDVGDTSPDIFRRDLCASPPVTERVSATANGTDPPGQSSRPSISNDGRFVAYNSTYNAITGNITGPSQVYLRDMSKAPGAAGWMTLVTEAGGSGTADDDSLRAVVSGDGNFVTFVSDATDLVPGDTNGFRDVFRWERATGQVRRVSVTSDGNNGGNIRGVSTRPWINGDGRYVTFQTAGGNVVPGDDNFNDDVFRADMSTDPPTIERVSVTPSGGNAQGASTRIQIDYSGRYVVFASNSHQLVPNDRNNERDVFRRDMVTNTTVRVSVDPSGGDSLPTCSPAGPDSPVVPERRAGAQGISTRPDISDDGTKVLFVSGSCNLVAGDNNELDDIFVRTLG